MRPDLRRLRYHPDVIAASMASNLFAMALPLTMLHLFDRVIPNHGVATLLVLGAGVLLAGVADFAIRAARSRIVAAAAERFETETHAAAMDRLFHPGTEPSQEGVAALFDRIEAIGRVRRHYAGDAAMALLDLPFVAVFLALMCMISPTLGGTAAALSAAAFGIVALQRRQILSLTQDRQDRDQRRQSFLTETLEGIEQVKALGAEALLQRRYERLMAAGAVTTSRLAGRVSFAQGVTGTISLVAPVVMAGVGAHLVLQDRMSVGGLAAGVLLASRIIQPILRIEALFAGERDIGPARADLQSLVAAPHGAGGCQPLSGISRLSLQAVALSPPSGDGPRPPGISLTLRRGDCVHLNGTDPRDVSRLLAIMAGHSTPAGGSVILDGRALAAHDPFDVARRIVRLTPDARFLDGTLMDNITGFDPKNRDRALHYARLLGLDAFAAVHPQGYRMQVAGTAAVGMPQSARHAALLTGGLSSAPDVILFDEANRGLDRDADDALIALLRSLKPDCILVLVTHRPSLIALADRRLVLDAGHLSEIPARQPAARAPRPAPLLLPRDALVTP